jgi:hypothetical protein
MNCKLFDVQKIQQAASFPHRHSSRIFVTTKTHSQAGAELCQAQFKLELPKPDLSKIGLIEVRAK